MASKYTFFLKFNDYPQREIQVFEAFGMDGFTFAVKQKEKSWARDVYKFNEDTELRFVSNKFSLADAVQYDINGNQIHYLTHGFDFILDALNENGAEASIEFIIKDNGAEFLRSDLDFEDYDSDNVYELKCKTIENNKRSKFKINKDIDIDLFSDKDLDGNSITPLTPLKVLLQSKPIEKFSRYEQTQAFEHTLVCYGGGDGAFLRPHDTIKNGDIEDTLIGFGTFTYVPPSSTDTQVNEYADTIKAINSQNINTNLKIKITFDQLTILNTTGFSTGKKLLVSYGTHFVLDSFDFELIDTTGDISQTNQVYEVNIPRVSQGVNVWVGLTITQPNGIPSGTPISTTYINVVNMNVEILSTESTIDTVIDCTRWIDGQKQASIMSGGLPLNSPRWELGGKYYDYVIASGYGIRGLLNRPFTTTAEKILDSTMFLTGDYQITEDSIECGTYIDFYGNTEIGRFLIAPDESFSYNTNKRYRIKTFGIKNAKYEQDRDEENTLDAIHTEMQQKTPNFKAKNTKLVTVEPIIDAYSIESARRLGLDPKTKNTSLTNDNDVYLLNITAIGETLKSYTGVFLQQANGSELTILSTSFAWTVIGIVVGDTFEITEGFNIGVYTITSIEQDILVLSGSPLFSGNYQITFEYTVSGVDYKSRTNEGFSNIMGVLNGDNYANLMLQMRRIEEEWHPYLATSSMRHLSGQIINTSFKNNDNLETTLSGGNPYIDKAPILVFSISDLKRITDQTFKTWFYANPNDVKELIRKSNERQLDGSVGGCVTLYDNQNNEVQVYIQDWTYLLREGKVEAMCEIKYIDDYFNVDANNKDLIDNYEINEVWVNLYDFNNVPLAVKKRFTKIKVNGVLYADIPSFETALLNYLNS